MSFGLGLGSAATWLYGARAEVSEHLTYERLLDVSIGASGGEVVSQLGYPLFIKGNGSTWPAPLGHSDPWPEAYVWVYASPTNWFMHEGLAVYVSFKQDRVSGVYAKYDDLPMYWRPATEADGPERMLRLKQALARACESRLGWPP